MTSPIPVSRDFRSPKAETRRALARAAVRPTSIVGFLLGLAGIVTVAVGLFALVAYRQEWL